MSHILAHLNPRGLRIRGAPLVPKMTLSFLFTITYRRHGFRAASRVSYRSGPNYVCMENLFTYRRPFFLKARPPVCCRRKRIDGPSHRAIYTLKRRRISSAGQLISFVLIYSPKFQALPFSPRMMS